MSALNCGYIRHVMDFFDRREEWDWPSDRRRVREYEKKARAYEASLRRNFTALVNSASSSLQHLSVKAVVGGSEHFTRHPQLLSMIPRSVAQLVLEEALKHLLSGEKVFGLVELLASGGLVTSYSHPSVQLNDRLLPALLKCPGLQRLECTQDVQYKPFSAKFTVKLHLQQDATGPGLRSLVWPLRDGRALLSSVAALQQLEELDSRGFCFLQRSHVNMVAEAVDAMPSLQVLRLGYLSSHEMLRLVDGLRDRERRLLLDASATLEFCRLRGPWPKGVVVERLRLHALGGVDVVDEAAVQRLRSFPADSLRELKIEVPPDDAAYLSLLDLLGAHLITLHVCYLSQEEVRVPIDLVGILTRIPNATSFRCDLPKRLYTEPTPEQLLRVPFENFEHFHVSGLKGSELVFQEAFAQRVKLL